MRFTVIDKTTGKAPDTQQIALHEDWADGLIYCDMEGFAIQEDGILILMDECGNFRYCPPHRFDIIQETIIKRAFDFLFHRIRKQMN